MSMNQLEGILRIKIDDKVLDIKEFDITFVPGMIRMDAKNFKLHGTFEEAPPVEIKAEEIDNEERAETPVITQQQIDKEFKKEEV